MVHSCVVKRDVPVQFFYGRTFMSDPGMTCCSDDRGIKVEGQRSCHSLFKEKTYLMGRFHKTTSSYLFLPSCYILESIEGYFRSHLISQLLFHTLHKTVLCLWEGGWSYWSYVYIWSLIKRIVVLDVDINRISFVNYLLTTYYISVGTDSWFIRVCIYIWVQKSNHI